MKQDEASHKAVADYANAILDNMLREAIQSSRQAKLRIQKILDTPSVCGYEGRQTDTLLMPGAVYAIGYYVYTGKSAKAEDCLYINNEQRKH